MNFFDDSLKTLKDCAKYNTTNLVLDEILVNNSPNNTLCINKNNTEIQLYVKGRNFIAMKIALEMRIYDSNDIPLIIYSPNHQTGFTQIFEQGEFEISADLQLPQGLSRGRFYADIYLTNPLVEGYVEIIRGLIIESEGYPTETGFVFDYSKGHGLIYLH